MKASDLYLVMHACVPNGPLAMEQELLPKRETFPARLESN